MIKIVLTSIAIFVAAYLVPWVAIDGFLRAILVAIVLWLVNNTFGLVLKILTLPLNILTFGIIGWLINIGMIQLADYLVPWFSTDWFWATVLFAIVVSLLQWLIQWQWRTYKSR